MHDRVVFLQPFIELCGCHVRQSREELGECIQRKSCPEAVHLLGYALDAAPSFIAVSSRTTGSDEDAGPVFEPLTQFRQEPSGEIG